MHGKEREESKNYGMQIQQKVIFKLGRRPHKI
jgi:hypothetical protein